VYGATLAHRQATDLRAAGIDAANRTAVDAFLKRAETGKYSLNTQSVVVVDEVSMLSSKQQLALMRLQRQHGFVLAAVGDFAQLQSVEASAGMKLIEQALPDIPQILTSIRQRRQSERDITQLFREGDAAEALSRKQGDGTAIIVAGGRVRTVERVARLWQERIEANKDNRDFKLSVSTVSNADVREIGEVHPHCPARSRGIGG
jgi:ATP-dependent exoDNAse (exonuclease V) alpha subunit